jgi:ssDNA-binding replication factor A large subunit
MSNSMEELYQKLLVSGISEQQLEQELERKIKEFGGFMTKQGILFIIAKEHGINPYNDALYKELEEMIDYDEFSITVEEIKEQMTNIVLLGKILSFSQPYEFTRKDSSIGKVSSFTLVDWTGVIKVVLWEENAQLVESEFFKKGELIRVIGGYSKKGENYSVELHIGKKGRVILAPVDVSKKLRNHLATINEELILKRPKTSKFLIKDLMEQDSFIRELQGKIKIEYFKEITKKSGDKTFLLKILVSDKSATIRVNIWDMEAVESLKLLEDECNIVITNLIIKKNSFTQEKELLFTKKSTLQIL